MKFIVFVGIILVAVFSWATHSFCYTLGELKGFRKCSKMDDECIEKIKKIYSDYIDELEEEIRKMQEGSDV